MILTLDLGTSAVKVRLFSLDGEVLRQSIARYPTYHPHPGWAEQDPEEWWQAVVSGVREVMRDAPRDQNLAAIGLTSQREGVVLLDRQRRPLGRCIIWMDRRAQPEAEELAALVPDLHDRTGMIPDATFTAAKLLWLKHHEHETIGAADVLLQPRDYLYFRLTGQSLTDHSLASRTMLYDIKRGDWAEDLLDAVGVRRTILPEILPSASMPSTVTKDAATALGIPPGIGVAVGGGDRPCEVLGAGATAQAPTESSGTANNISLPSPLPEHAPPGILVSAHVVPGLVLLEQGFTASGPILDWLGRLLSADGRPSTSEDGALGRASMSPPGANGLLLLPHFHGARAPWWNPRAKAGWFGLTPTHNSEDMLRSALEAVAFDGRACIEALERAGRTVREVILVGGDARSRLWAEIKASVWRRPVVIPQVTDAASMGAMIVAAAALKIFSINNVPRLNAPVERHDPDPGLSDRYDEIYAAYRRLYTTVNAGSL